MIHETTVFCEPDLPLSIGISGGLKVGPQGTQLVVYSTVDPQRFEAGDVPAGLVALLERMLEVARRGYQPEAL
jgi:hypothetical protein